MPTERELANLEAERQLLGRLLLENDLFWRVAEIIEPSAFSLALHQELFARMGELIEAGELANPITLKQYFAGEVNGRPATAYLLSLSKDAVSVVNLEDYAKTILNLALRREIVFASNLVAQEAEQADVHQTIEQLLERADATFSQVRSQLPGSLADTSSIAAVSQEALVRLEEQRKLEASPHPRLGLPGVDRLIGPLAPGSVFVIAGRPGSGKTAAAVAAGRSIVRQKDPMGRNFGVSYFSLEVTKSDIWNRFMSCEMALTQTPVYYMALKRGNVNDIQMQALRRFSDSFSAFPLSIHDKSGVTVAQIYMKARAEKQKLNERGLNLHVVIVDYLQIIRPSGRYAGNKVAEISEISTGLLQLAKDLDVAVIAVAQLSRSVENRHDKRPIMADLRESGQIEQDANSIILLYRPAYYDAANINEAPPDLLEVFKARENDLHYIVAKARDGMPGEVVNFCDIGKNHIADKRKQLNPA